MPPEPEPIWARWNAKAPDAMANDYVDADDGYLAAVEALDDATRGRPRVPFHLGSVDLASYLTLQLTEHTLHNWDIRAAFHPGVTLAASAVPPLIDVLLTIDEGLSLRLLNEEQAAAIRPCPGRLELPTEALMRLAAGRLDPDHTPARTGTYGRPTLDDLRQLFPGLLVCGR